MSRKRYKPSEGYRHNRRIEAQITKRGLSSPEELYTYLSKQANKRLANIEKASDDPVYGNMKYYAYRTAQYDIKRMGGTGGRFPTDLPLTEKGTVDHRVLQGRLNAVQHFMESPSSTKEGTREVYIKRANTLNAKMGTTLSWQDLARYYDSEAAEKASKEYGSDTRIRALGSIKRIAKNPDKIAAAIKGNLKLSKNDAVDEAAKYMLRNGLDPSILK